MTPLGGGHAGGVGELAPLYERTSRIRRVGIPKFRKVKRKIMIKWGLWVAGLLATSDAGASPSVVLAGMFADDMGLPAPLATVGTPEQKVAPFLLLFFGGFSGAGGMLCCDAVTRIQ